MDKDTFHHRLVQALISSDFLFRTRDQSTQGLCEERDRLSKTARMIAELGPPTIRRIHPIFDQEVVQERLDKLSEWASLVCFKYVLAQPVVVAAIEADQLSSDSLFGFASRLDETVVEMLDATGRLGGAKIGGVQLLKGTRLSVTGILLCVFYDHALASAFIQGTQSRCKVLHFFKKTWVLPWAIDVSAKSVAKHRGLPFLPGVINRDQLQKEIFG